MKRENARRDKEQGVVIRAEDVNTSELEDGQHSFNWRYFT